MTICEECKNETARTFWTPNDPRHLCKSCKFKNRIIPAPLSMNPVLYVQTMAREIIKEKSSVGPLGDLKKRVYRGPGR
uniref:Uncharacterized protein n=1 Tax=viral metagenome TaxID=1070528 RepID=A0A6M3L4B6_9ZZZZ